jgi:hypothetical protein
LLYAPLESLQLPLKEKNGGGVIGHMGNLDEMGVRGLKMIFPDAIDKIYRITTMGSDKTVQEIIFALETEVKATADERTGLGLQVSICPGQRLPNVSKNPEGDKVSGSHYLQGRKAAKISDYLPPLSF